MAIKLQEHVGKVGTLDGYSNHGCRCPECTRLWREYLAKRRAERAQEPIPDDIHGKYTTYQNWGCRCVACKKAANESKRMRGLRKLAEGKLKHGTLHAYNCGCRCDLCTEARRVNGALNRLPGQIALARKRLAMLEARLAAISAGSRD